MYQTLAICHNYVRWLVLFSLLYTLFRSWRGYALNSRFSKTDNAVRHWTATIAHIQLMIGVILYFRSPTVTYFRENFREALSNIDSIFFAIIHSSLMIAAIIMITIGSAVAKRKEGDKEKFRTMLIWFSIALVIIFIAIPWPFSPLAVRPYLR